MTFSTVELAQAIVIIGAASEVLRRVARRLWRMCKAIGAAVHLIQMELAPNGGGSLVDQIKVVRHRLDNIESSLRTFERGCPLVNQRGSER